MSRIQAITSAAGFLFCLYAVPCIAIATGSPRLNLTLLTKSANGQFLPGEPLEALLVCKTTNTDGSARP
ncbi:MAG: hypothetical protein U9R68_04725, partial [Planctomycetota bacterium]|nr:hypothetical protein [Planctomycetota bacterium]